MNTPYTKDLQLTPLSDEIIPQPYDATVQEIYDNASKRLAAVKSVDLKVASAEKAIQTVKGQLMPTIYLYGGLYSNYSSAATAEQYINSTDVATNSYVLLNNVKNTVYNTQQNFASIPLSYGNQISNNLNSQIGIGLNIPILNNFLYKNKLRLAKVAEKQATVQAQTTKIQLRQAIEQDYVNLNAAYQTYLKLMNQVSYFEQSLHAADVRFSAGAITIVDYVIAKNNFDRASINLIAAKYDYVLRTKVLDFFQSRNIY
jgi:outer membrane protein